jgi:hypothetical protein
VDEFEQQGAEAPPVDCPSVALLADDLGSQVLGSAAKGEGLVVAEDVAAGEAEVGELDEAVLADEDVLGLEAAWAGEYSR